MIAEFNAEEERILKPYVTNLEKPIFALRNLPEVVMGALFSRYSRTNKSLRRVLLDEFILNKEMGFEEIVGFSEKEGTDQIVATQRAEEFYDRVLVGYGDDSVAELGGAHIACEDVSNIASKMLEDPRIGLSPLEKSTRYVYFNQKVEGRYRYYRGEELLNAEFADNYLNACDHLFDTYSNLMEKMNKYMTECYPKGAEVSERAYQTSIRAKVCDSLRGLLPAATKTNVGIFGNGRAFEYLLMKMYASEMKEMNLLAGSMQAELNKVIPSFVKRANDKYGKASQDYLKGSKEGMRKIASALITAGDAEKAEEVTLIDYDQDAEVKVIAAMLYPFTDLPLKGVREKVGKMEGEVKKRIIAEYLKRRENRRHKPGRALENSYYTFDLLANFGQYRDLQRHRILTQERQLLNCRHGYDLPKEITDAGVEEEFGEAMEVAKECWGRMARISPEYAQYVVPLAYKLRWYVKMNMREVCHLTELRSMQQGHSDYRRVAQRIYVEVKRVHPQFAEYFKFVDMKEYGLERLEAEKKIDKKMDELKRKYS